MKHSSSANHKSPSTHLAAAAVVNALGLGAGVRSAAQDVLVSLHDQCAALDEVARA